MPPAEEIEEGGGSVLGGRRAEGGWGGLDGQQKRGEVPVMAVPPAFTLAGCTREKARKGQGNREYSPQLGATLPSTADKVS